MSDQSGAGAMPSPNQSGGGAMPSADPGTGATPTPGNPPGAGATPSPTQPEPDAGRRDANRDGQHDDDAGRDAAALGEDGERALREERAARRELERELKRLQDAEKARADAGKSELERATERADIAERRVAQMEREALARQVAGEAGIPTLWHRLSGDDVRALRADATRLREELGIGAGAMDGGVRSLGVPAQPTSMDDLIRGGARR